MLHNNSPIVLYDRTILFIRCRFDMTLGLTKCANLNIQFKKGLWATSTGIHKKQSMERTRKIVLVLGRQLRQILSNRKHKSVDMLIAFSNQLIRLTMR